MTNGEILGKKLYELRKAAGLSQEDLAEKLGVSRQAVSKWECGESWPDTDNLITIARLYNVSLDELIGNSSPHPEEDKRKDPATGQPAQADVRNNGKSYPDKRERALRILRALPYPILVTVIFLLWGFLWNGWAVSWTLFLTIPIYPTVLDCIRTKRLSPFAYPVFITFVYLFIGMQWNLWHPYWILYITIPIYYPIAKAIDRK
ncbi:MAG: helix-turn-helix domain-containing protein [Clostridia bacterium]|nr:helix-turn-helix domain-containing protein [Clostridia bacterium]